MNKSFWVSRSSWMKCLLLVCSAAVASTAMAEPDPVAQLLEKHASLKEQLRNNQFKRPLVMHSAESRDGVKGDIYAVVDHPFAVASAGLKSADNWCDVMILHINTKYCHAVAEPSGTTLRVYIGRKTPEELADAERVVFNYSVPAATPEYFEIKLNADEGPPGSSDYRVRLQAVALPNNKTFLHLTYSYSISFSGRLATQTYLATIGTGKVGFTVTGKQADGQPQYVGGMRGIVERNTMRYYLAIDTFLGTANAPPAARLEQRLQGWFTAVGRYPQQLHEMDRKEYLEMKRAEHLRQQKLH
ncbi:MAG: hypothetical protein V7606_2036 [Burkholderiales bacterium]|jgi:hypothetical protein